MDQTAKLKIEFFELTRLLNQSNQKVNQKTEITFYIKHAEYKSTLYATTNKVYKMQLIAKKIDGYWTSCGFSGVDLIEKELSKLFRNFDTENRSANEITKIIKSFIFKQFDEQ